MSLANNFCEYKDEIELIHAQNRVECDLYSIIAQIIRESAQGRDISLRDVSVRRKTEFSKSFRGHFGFPDFVIRTREKSNDAQILGAIEVKYLTEDLDLEKYLKQLEAHITFYKLVIYTNGLVWRFYNGNSSKEDWEISLGEIINNNFKWANKKQWGNLMMELNNISWTD